MAVTLATLVGNLLARWIGGSRRRAQLKALAELRERGVVLRNEAIRPRAIVTDDDLTRWIKRRDAWHREARVTIRALAEHEAVAFETLGTVSQNDVVAGVYTVSDSSRQVAFLTVWIDRLEEIRRRYSPTG